MSSPAQKFIQSGMSLSVANLRSASQKVIQSLSGILILAICLIFINAIDKLAQTLLEFSLIRTNADLIPRILGFPL